MKKLLFVVAAASMMFLAVGCDKGKKKAETAANQPQGEYITQIEAYWQLQSSGPSVDASTRLHCRYILAQDNNGNLARHQAEARTSASCDWNALKGQVSPAGVISDDHAYKIMQVTDNLNLPATGTPSWNCAVYNIMTNMRSVSLQDCNIPFNNRSASGTPEYAAEEITRILGLK